jgi:hypothetical protein
MPIFLKSGNLKLLETSGPVHACNGIALPFTKIVPFTGYLQEMRQKKKDQRSSQLNLKWYRIAAICMACD